MAFAADIITRPIILRGSENGSGAPRVTVSIETITPELAEHYLTFNRSNRRLRRIKLDQYASDLDAGNWHLNGETIKFSTDGRLIDGQHRLHACVRTGVPFESIVVRNVREESYITIDAGASKSLANYLDHVGEKRAAELASSLRVAYMLDHRAVSGNHWAGSHATPTQSQLVAYLAENPGIRDHLSLAKSMMNKYRGLRSVYAAVLYLFARAHGDDVVHDFVERLLKPEQGTVYSLLADVLSRWAVRREQVGGAVYAALLIKAMNAHITGQEVKLLAYRPNSGEKFPEIVEPL